MTNTDKRLIEDYIPIKKISEEASREKSIRHGHISTLHLWWARRPLVASRAAVFGALVPAGKTPEEQSYLTDLMIRLCKWKVDERTLDEARALIRDSYPDEPPKVLDMFAGGGSIPLEALRLGCEAYALDLNPVAHIIELATLVYPQKYGPKLADDVRKWGDWVLERVRAEVGDLYPLIPDPEFTPEKAQAFADLHTQPRLFAHTAGEQMTLADADSEADDEEETFDGTTADVPFGYLQPVAYLWTRTVTCPNPACRATVPVVRQTWLKKKGNYVVALKVTPHDTENRMAFHVVRARDQKALGFDPAGFSQRGISVCRQCGTTVAIDYIKSQGKAGYIGTQIMAVVCMRPQTQTKVYLSPDDLPLAIPDEAAIWLRIERLVTETGITPPDEEIETNPRSMDNEVYGFTRWSQLFTPRQMLTLLTFIKYNRQAYEEILATGFDSEYARAIATYLALALDKATDRNSTLCNWDLSSSNGRLGHTFTRQSLPMVWDYAEANPLAGSGGDLKLAIQGVSSVILNAPPGFEAHVQRGSATNQPYDNHTMDVVITDPPYYDNVSYSNLSDFFYVWLKRAIGDLYPEHFSAELTPKKNEIIAANYRHSDKNAARQFYETMMLNALSEAYRVLKPGGTMTVVYAHKTTAGWSTLVDALRVAGFAITEAWPMDTEMPARSIAMDTAALASSIFLVARKRDENQVRWRLDRSRLDSETRLVECADYINTVLPEMRELVAERVRFFLQSGITGADLSIATVGAALAPYTRYGCVELPNGEQLSSAAYLTEVQREIVRVVLGEAASADDPTQYYLMARHNYGEAWVEFDEANNLARAISIELDSGPDALTRGSNPLIAKDKSKMRVRGYAERGDHDDLGLPTAERPRAPLIDVLHRLLWLAENDNAQISEFLGLALPDKYLLRVVAEALKGTVLAAEPTPGAMKDERSPEQKTIQTLLASWRRVVDEKAIL